jgi:hypothetical protein|tara:strand:- start:50 stop:802 length:753 start_codon:yes stop_codon:yes gene_type:complete
MKAKPIVWRGMEFRSKLEARYFNHFKKLDWDFDYEPAVPGLIGYQPDFVLYPSKKRAERFGNKPIYVEIKPIRDVTNYWRDSDYNDFREKIKKYWNPQNDLILFGGALKNRFDTAAVALCLENKIYDHLTSYQFKYSYTDGYLRIGLSMFGVYEYLLDDKPPTEEIMFDYALDNKFNPQYQKIIDTVESSWNNAWSQMRWQPKLSIEQKVERAKTIDDIININEQVSEKEMDEYMKRNHDYETYDYWKNE